MTFKVLTDHHLGVSKLKSRLHRLIFVYTCQNARLLEITYRGSIICEPTDEILVLIITSQRLPLNASADMTSGARRQIYGPNLHRHPYLMYACIEVSGKTVQMRRFN